MDDVNRLVEKALNGDPKAYSRIVTIYQNRVYGFLLKLTLKKEDAEDILQDTFIRAYNYLYKYDPKYEFSTWLFQIAHNTFKTHYKKKKEHMNVSLDEMQPALSNKEMSPELQFEEKENYQAVVKIISELSPEQKTAFLLKYYQGYKFKEIGDIMKISTEAAKMKVQRAKETIGKKFAQIKKEGQLYEVS